MSQDLPKGHYACTIANPNFHHHSIAGMDLQYTSRLTVVSREAKEEAASGAPMDSRLTLVSILQEQEL